MAVKVGSARIDERGKAYGGKAGDNTGKEVSTQNYYVHSKGWRVLRPINTAKAEKIAKCMQAACDNNTIGYDQWQRLTLYNAAKSVGFDCAKVTTKCETDCSALVRVCLAYAGITVGNFRTTNQAKLMLATGEFIELTGSEYTKSSDYLKRGDVLVTKTQGHTVVVLSDGSKADESKNTTSTLGDRTLRKGCSGPDVMELQEMLLELKYQLQVYGADGQYGAETEAAVRRFQKNYRLEVDGIAGPITISTLVEACGADGDISEDEPEEGPPSNSYVVDFLDLSSHNSYREPRIDWEKVSKTVGFLVLRCGCNRTKTKPLGIGPDTYFESWAARCNEFKIPFWAYFYSKAKSLEEARKEARYMVQVAAKYKPIGLCMDAEEGCLDRDTIEAFFDELKDHWNGKTMIYQANHRRKKYGLPTDKDGFVSICDATWVPYYGKNDGKLHKNKIPGYPCDAVQGTSKYSHPAIPDKTLDANFITGQRRTLAWFRGESDK